MQNYISKIKTKFLVLKLFIIKILLICKPKLSKNEKEFIKEYRFVVFKDMSNDYMFLTRSTAQSKETIVWEDGNEYPLIKVEISNTSHPFLL